MLATLFSASGVACLALTAVMLRAQADETKAQAKAAALSKEQYGVIIDRDIRIPMRDGVELMADVYRPSEGGKKIDGRFPVILIRTCYDKDSRRGIFLFDPPFFARRGYTVVIQDVRGRYKSPGRFYHGIYEGKDGYDTIEWIAKQPWSNGKVGMTGLSYLAAVQQAAAAAGAVHLSSMFHIQAPLSYYQNGVRRGGAFVQMVVPVAFYFGSTSREAIADPVLRKALIEADMKGPEWLKRWPFGRGRTILSSVPEDERFLLDTWVNTDFDRYYKDVHLWEPHLFIDQYTDAPNFYFGGWYDQYRANDFYTALAGRKKGPIKLFIGPWGHGTNASFLGDVDFGPDAVLTEEQGNHLQLRWFDQSLKGIDTGIFSEPDVRVFVMGGGDGRKDGAGRLRHGGRWRAEKSWPFPNTRFTNYYLQPSSSLSPSAPAQPESSSAYSYDPKHPVPTIGGASYFVIRSVTPSRYFVPYGPQDQRESEMCLFCKTTLPLAVRQDVMVFQTPPLEQDVEVTGPLSTKLWVSSSAVSTDFTAKLIDVYPPSEDYPDGYAMNLADGILRTHYRNGFEKRELMKPGEIYQITIPMFATGNLFKKGHRIRLDISSSDYPAYDPNPNTGDPYMIGNQSVVAKNVVYHDKQRPSHIVLPVIPR
jgi:uncharacterized protein